ncbi:MAG: DNA translocase FtsK [Hyphomicrobiales bacterium]
MTDTADFHGLGDEDRGGPLINRTKSRLIGLGIIAASLAACLALATWNVDDPSLTHATDRSVSNWLGFPGAAISDLLVQFFGFTSSILVLLPAIWGWQFFRFKTSYVGAAQILGFFGIVILSCAVAACMPVPSSWPLPTGLGGLVGNGIIALPAFLLGDSFSGFFAVVVAIILAIPLPFLAKFVFANNTVEFEDEISEPTARRPMIGDEGEQDDANEPREGWLLPTALGAAAHLGYSAKAKLKNLTSSKRARILREPVPQHDLTMEGPVGRKTGFAGAVQTLVNFKKKLIDEPADNDGLGDYLEPTPSEYDMVEQPMEPTVSLQPAPAMQPVAPQPAADLVEAEQYPTDITAPRATVERVQTPAPAPTPAPSAPTGLRVAQPTPPAKPSRRAIKEAQPPLPTFKDPSEFELPPLHLLSEAPENHGEHALSNDDLAANAQLLEGVLEDFGVKGEIVHVRPGPVVTLYELEPAPGIKSSRVIGLADDIARSMSAIAARVAVIPGKNAIGIELPNASRETIYLHESIASKTFDSNKGKLPICLGKTIGGEGVIADLAKMPHLLVAGTTGSGKSVAINTMILSLLFRMTPEECKMIMIDPKMLELSVYDGIPHLLTPVVTDPKKAVVALKWTVREMEDRYRKMSKVGVRNIDGFNTRVKQAAEKGEPIVRTIQTGYDQETGEAIYEREELDLAPLPFIVVIIDEMADLMMVAGKDIEGAIQRLAQMARAAGIHVIMATQRPSVDVITGTIKANFPTRISFQVTSKIDSRTILGEQGAEQLLGMGDMLYMAAGGRTQRVHGPFVDDSEVEDIVMHLKDQGIPQYVGAVTEEVDEDEGDTAANDTGGNVDSDDPYDKAVAVVLRDKKASTSYIQRRLGIGYNRAASIIERMEEEGVVGPANHAGKREILVGSDPDEDFAFRE